VNRFEAVLFDFGGVFIDSPFAAAETGAAELGVPFEQLSGIVFGPYDRDTDHPWHRLERGELDLRAARREIGRLAREAGIEGLDPLGVLASLATSGGVREFVVDLVREVRASGRRTGIVTNNVAEFGTYWRSMLPLDELFDDVVDSSEVGLRKPSPEIFHLACERLEVTAERAVFLDDFEGNVAGARAAGLHAICCGLTVETTAEAVGTLRRLLGLSAG
jgi:epoxide hydrolase-like predicted phosphatase